MPKVANTIFQLGDLRVYPSLDEIRKDGVSIKLEPRTMRLLVCLAERPGPSDSRATPMNGYGMSTTSWRITEFG